VFLACGHWQCAVCPLTGSGQHQWCEVSGSSRQDAVQVHIWNHRTCRAACQPVHVAWNDLCHFSFTMSTPKAISVWNLIMDRDLKGLTHFLIFPAAFECCWMVTLAVHTHSLVRSSLTGQFSREWPCPYLTHLCLYGGLLYAYFSRILDFGMSRLWKNESCCVMLQQMVSIPKYLEDVYSW